MGLDRSAFTRLHAGARPLIVLLALLTSSSTGFAQTQAAVPAAAAPRVRLVATGGTISNRTGGRLSAEELVKSMPGIERYAQPEFEQFSNLASAELTLDQWIALATRLDHPDAAVARHRVRYHRAITRLEDVQRQMHPRKQQRSREREDREPRRRHVKRIADSRRRCADTQGSSNPTTSSSLRNCARAAPSFQARSLATIAAETTLTSARWSGAGTGHPAR